MIPFEREKEGIRFRHQTEGMHGKEVPFHVLWQASARNMSVQDIKDCKLIRIPFPAPVQKCCLCCCWAIGLASASN